MTDSALDNNRGLKTTFKPLTQMVRGASAEGQDTKRAVARALKKQGQKTLAIIPVKDPVLPSKLVDG